MSIILDGNAGITYPDVTSQNTSAVIGGKLPTAKLPAGSVLQVVQGTYSSYSALTSSTWVDTGLTASITPTSSTSKILVLVCMRAYANISCDYGGIRLLRGASTLFSDGRVCLRDATSPGSDQVWNRVYLDSPSTTSSTTYKLQAQNGLANGTFYIMLDSNIATITLMEIAV